jgi:CRISPR-associated endonuclease Cas2
MYDIENDRIRRKVAEDCKDSGLERVQYSVFRGLMPGWAGELAPVS